MNILTKGKIILHVVRWLLTWKKHDCHYPSPVPENPKFMTAWDAVALIRDGAVMATSGIGGNQRCSLMYWAIRERFDAEQHPRNLTVVCIGGQGGRGKVPGTLEEIAVEGLNSRMFTGHTETFKGQLKLADAGKIEIQCMPQGTLMLVVKAQSEGRDHIINRTGVGTFVDPRTGRGTPVMPPDAAQYVEVLEDGSLKYWLPPIDTAVFSAPAADRKGNIYVKNCAVLCESYEIAKAARRNGGKVIVNVGLLVEEGYDDIFLPAEEVDAVVYWPGTEQTGSVTHNKYWDFLTLNSASSEAEGLARLKLVNNILGITPKRKPIDNVLARLATRIFVDHARAGDHVDIGVGLPEEVSRLLYESGAMDKLYMMNESGVFGGVSAPGVFFGAAVNPREIVSSATAFERLYERLDWAILGALQIDSDGNVNVSKRGEGAINYVGPGGFIDLVTSAKSIMFCSAWGDRAQFEIDNGKVTVVKQGKPKFIGKVDEITFNGREALKQGKQVFYVTHVGAFRLTERGMELMCVVPGVDVQKDILDVCPMKIVLPEKGAPETVSPEIVTGKNYRLSLND
ncbi:MAG TPA: hypothetical protein ENN29_07190 [Candidatus Hydrogenedentes bacterium]|nr:hypothetical protein [Candidatus Hydrogenedentota bacterium]